MPPKGKGGSRGLSLKQKQDIMLDILHTEPISVYQMKDLEKIGSKRGVPSMVIKSIVTQMADEDLLESEKIGTSWYYWDFPSQRFHLLKRAREKAEADLADAVEAESIVSGKKAKLASERKQSKARTAALKEIATLRSKIAVCNSKLREQGECDPEYVDALSTWENVCKEAANRWTDNIHLVSDELEKHASVDMKRFADTFGHFNYID